MRAVDPDGVWYVLHAEQQMTETPSMLDAFFRAVDTYKPDAVGVEQVAGARLLNYILPQEAERRKIDLPPLERVGGGTGTTKEHRCRQLLPYFERHAIKIRREQVCLRDAILRFPKKPYDVLDSLAMHMDLESAGVRPVVAVEEEDLAPEGSFLWAVKQARERGKPGDGDVHPVLRPYA